MVQGFGDLGSGARRGNHLFKEISFTSGVDKVAVAMRVSAVSGCRNVAFQGLAFT